MSKNEDPIVRLSGIRKSFGKKNVLQNLNLTVRENEILGLLGPNGAGKTTLLRIIARYLLPDMGTLEFRKNRLSGDRSQAVVGYLPEKVPLFEALTVERYLRLVASLKEIHQDLVHEKVDSVLNAFGMQRVKKNVIANLSKGYKQRVGLSQAFLGDSDLLILDEPMSGLDPFQLADVRDMILGAADKRAILFSTHVVHEIELLCSRSVFLNGGALLEIDKESEDFAVVEFRVRSPDVGRLQSLVKSALGECILDSKEIGGGEYKISLKLLSSQIPKISKLLANNSELMSFRETNLGIEARLASLRRKVS